ncbi:MAG: amidase [Planctomycetota bacterium]|nr:amidase [Planctomycetota bacterium]
MPPSKNTPSGPIEPDRRNFLAAAAVSAVTVHPFSTNAPHASPQKPVTNVKPSFELSELSISTLQERLQSGQDSARSLVDKYLARITELNPCLGSVIELNPEAAGIADELDRERSQGKLRGPLHGIPILIKDNIDTADQMKTTAGSLALLNTPTPTSDAFVVQRLRTAGAVLLGKTNLSEWANIRSNRSTSGWSGRGGQTNNPYVLDRNPCGSSSGSGAAVAASLCAVAIGTETDGSVLCPSSACGIVGIKPTVGLVGRTGIIPISHSQDTAGPMARTVRDAAILLSVMAGVDPDDPATVAAHDHLHADYTTFLEDAGLDGARIGVARNFFGYHDGVDGVMDDALETLRRRGATLIDTDHLAVTENASAAETTVFQYELKHGMAAYLARLGDDSPMKTLQDLIDFNEQHKDREMPYFGQDFFLQSQEKGPLTDFEYVEARARCLRLTRTAGIDAGLAQHQLACFVAPTISLPCPTDLVNGDHWLSGSTRPAAIAGYPSISVPAGYVHGLPVGLSFFGPAWSEPTLLKLAYAFEQASALRQPPQFLPTLKLDG